MQLSKRIDSLVHLGLFLKQFSSVLPKKESLELNSIFYDSFNHLIETLHFHNQWFNEPNVRYSIQGICKFLTEKNLNAWVSHYPALEEYQGGKNIGVVMAGNIPLVGFHDMLSVLICGNHFIGKLSSKDDKLMKALIEALIYLEPEFREFIRFEEGFLKGFDAIIATGSNNSSRYFEYYFGKYPNIIRKNRNSIAVLSGDENSEQLKSFADDLFIYFGLGCRNVSKIYVPVGFDLQKLIANFTHFDYLRNHNKFANNYDYQKCIYLMNKIPHLDTGFTLLKEDSNITSPVSVIYYEYYSDLNTVKTQIAAMDDQIQCIVTEIKDLDKAIAFGFSQKPNVWDYADNMDTIEFQLAM
jgi:hypothetical protein